MRALYHRLLPFIVLALLLWGASGCNADKELAVAHRTYAVTLNALSDAREQGRISDETQRNVIAPARDATKGLLDALTTAHIEGRAFNFRGALAALYEAMRPLIIQREVLDATADVPTPD